MDSIDKLKFLKDELVGKYFRDENGVRFYAIRETSNAGFVCQEADNPTSSGRRLSFEQALKQYCNELKLADNGGRFPTGIKSLMVKALKRSDDASRDVAETKRALVNCTRSLETIKTRLNEAEQEADEQSKLLQSCQDNYTLPSLEKRHKDKIAKLEEAQVTYENALELSRQFSFKTDPELAQALTQATGINVKASNLRKWRSKGYDVSRQPGRPTALNKQDEQLLLEVVLFHDKVGFPMSRAQIIKLANEMVKDPSIKAQFGQNGPTNSWYNGWFKRAKQSNPELEEATARATSCNTLKWFNSNNINWWFDKFETMCVNRGFARKRSEDDSEDAGSIVWLHPTRVFITDETCVSGAKAKKAADKKRKVVTISDRIEKNSKGKGHRRIADAESITDEHITLVAGHNLVGEMTPPAWIFAGSGNMRQTTYTKIEEAAPKRIKFNDRTIDDVFIGHSSTGGITTENIDKVMLPMIEQMYPDVADVPGKRVLWLTDWHSSRLSVTLLEALRARGVTLFCWLPNTTSKMQAPDVALFGRTKSVRDRLERQWVEERNGKVDRYAKVAIAGMALLKTFTHKHIMDGLKQTGILPVDRDVLLAHPSARDGDEIHMVTNLACAVKSVKKMQELPKPDACESSPASTRTEHVESPVLRENAMRDLANSTSRKPRGALFRRVHSLRTSEYEDAHKLKNDTLEKVKSALESFDSQYEQQAMHFKEQASQEYHDKLEEHERYIAETKVNIEQKQREIEEMKRDIEKREQDKLDAKRCRDSSIRKYEYKRKQERHFLTQYSFSLQRSKSLENQSRKQIATIAQRMEDYTMAPRDMFGMPVNPDDPKFVPTPALEVHQNSNVDVEVLQHSIKTTAAGRLAKRARLANNTSVVQDDGTKEVPFRPGNLAANFGCEITDDFLTERARNFQEKSKTKAAAKKKRQEEKERKLIEKKESIERRVEQSKQPIIAAIGTGKSPTVQQCRLYLQLCKEQAIYNENCELEDQIKGILKLKPGKLIVNEIVKIFTSN